MTTIILVKAVTAAAAVAVSIYYPKIILALIIGNFNEIK
jgi:hypothetical protein